MKDIKHLKIKQIYVLYVIGLVLLNLIRIFDNNFWGDEAYTILLLKSNWIEMINMTANDVHPPLYYIISKIICSVVGFNGIGYHFSSFLPYILMIILAVTIVRKLYGEIASGVFISFASLLRSSLMYNVEVRMYSWGALFLLMSFLSMYRILQDNKKNSWIIFTISSLAAAYTHYYCLLSVAFFYIALIMYTVIRKKENINRIIFVCITTVAAYLPWLSVLFKTFQRTSTSKGFWQVEIPSFIECIRYMFDGRFDVILVLIFLISVSEFFIRTFLKHETDNGEIIEKFWVFSGILSIIGTSLVGIAVSYFIRPMFITRYLYPVSTIAWLTFSISIAKCKLKQLYVISTLILLWGYGFPHYLVLYRYEYQSNKNLEKTLALTCEKIESDDMILSDVSHIAWTISKLYYQENEVEFLDWDNFITIEPNKDYWFILEEELDNVTGEKISKANADYDLIVEDGVLGTMNVWIYKVNSKCYK